jgi:hypothetical protein
MITLARRNRRGRSSAIVTAVVTALAALVSAAPTALAAEPSSLAGEFVFSTPNASVQCSPDGTSIVSYAFTSPITGGPYPGDLTETATLSIGPLTTPSGFPYGAGAGYLTEATASFSIDSGDTQITGTKTMLGSTNTASCTQSQAAAQDFCQSRFGQDGEILIFAEGGTALTYEATITGPDGTYADSGTGSLFFHYLGVGCTGVGYVEASFSERWSSSNGVTPVGPATISLTPPDAVNVVGTSHSVTATVGNSAGGAVENALVRFNVSGSSSQSGSCATDSAGQCTFSYVGPTLPGADVIVAYADSDEDGVRDADEPMAEATKAWILPTSTPGQTTGGGQTLNPDADDNIAFGYNAQSTAASFKGNCELVDPSPARNVKIKCLDVTALVVGGTHATFFGNATVNGTATTYRIDVDDFGEPGAGSDTFQLSTANGYSYGGVLVHGNIQVHN